MEALNQANSQTSPHDLNQDPIIRLNPNTPKSNDSKEASLPQPQDLTLTVKRQTKKQLLHCGEAASIPNPTKPKRVQPTSPKRLGNHRRDV